MNSDIQMFQKMFQINYTRIHIRSMAEWGAYEGAVALCFLSFYLLQRSLLLALLLYVIKAISLLVAVVYSLNANFSRTISLFTATNIRARSFTRYFLFHSLHQRSSIVST